MIATFVPRGPERQAAAADRAPLLEQLATLQRENAALWAENAALRVEHGARHERIRELEAQREQTWANSSRPPSADPPPAPARPKVPPAGRNRGGQPGDGGLYCALLPAEQLADARLGLLGPKYCAGLFGDARRGRFG